MSIVAYGVLSRMISFKPRLMRRNVAGPGLVRLSMILSLSYVLFVLYNYADPSVVGIYRLLYFMMGWAILYVFGTFGSIITGMHSDIDVGERANMAGALLVASFILATGLIYGNSLWGDADPSGDGEGGWWIPMGFFLVAWSILAFVTRMYRVGEWGGNSRWIRHVRKPSEVLHFAVFIVSSGWVLAVAVAGDFHGWMDGLLPLGTLALMMIVHQMIANFNQRPDNKPSRGMSPLEAIVNIAITVGYTYVQRFVVASWGT
jgi:hypothetical protein